MPQKSWIERAKKEQKYEVREYNRCKICGHARSYMRKFKMCRKCFREYALRGEIPGVQKASW